MTSLSGHKLLILSDIFYALADPIRLRIATTLYNASSPLTCIEAVKNIDGLPLSTRSHCFKVLREKGVITTEVRGREHYNAIRITEIEKRFPGLLEIILKEI